MAQLTQQSHESKTTRNSVSPSQLWIGTPIQAAQSAQTYLQSQLCPKGGCAICTTCKQIEIKQHHAVLWLAPEKNYTREQFEPVFRELSFARNQDDPFFIIVQKADFLSLSCANSLLKVLEEPPAGYHFLLLAHRPDQIIPTIRSRCIEKIITGQDVSEEHLQLFNCIISEKPDPFTFQKILDQSKINERETVELFDTLVHHLIQKYKESIIKKHTKKETVLKHKLTIVQRNYSRLPMPGSSKLFWKQLYNQIHLDPF